MPAIDVQPQHLEIVRRILREHVPDREVRAFGSRVTRTAKPFSDFDLVVMGANPLPTTTLAALTDAFDESDLPFKVDIVDWAATGEAFRGIIAKQSISF